MKLTALSAQMKMNRLGKESVPFLFVIDYLLKSPVVIPLDDLPKCDIQYRIGESNQTRKLDFIPVLHKNPVSFERYYSGFARVKKALQRGDSFLVNYTQPTPIETNVSLEEIFQSSKARYNLLFKDEFVVFSPETFVKIKAGVISSFPMKGTQKATVTDTADEVIHSTKEMAEHATIVDLIRNDLSKYARNVKVDRYRYTDVIPTHQGGLLQVSTQISGVLPENYPEMIGDIIFDMLPAGSVTGAPKPQTLHIIDEVENYNRGYYTGVFGVFDGRNLDSAVMIRFIEKNPKGFVFKSGGGITALSDAQTEYNEMIDKVYLPF